MLIIEKHNEATAEPGFAGEQSSTLQSNVSAKADSTKGRHAKHAIIVKYYLSKFASFTMPIFDRIGFANTLPCNVELRSPGSARALSLSFNNYILKAYILIYIIKVRFKIIYIKIRPFFTILYHCSNHVILWINSQNLITLIYNIIIKMSK